MTAVSGNCAPRPLSCYTRDKENEKNLSTLGEKLEVVLGRLHFPQKVVELRESQLHEHIFCKRPAVQRQLELKERVARLPNLAAASGHYGQRWIKVVTGLKKGVS